METFTLVLWIMMGMRYEETQMADPMGAEQCLELLFAIQADRSPAFQADRTPAKGECVAGKLRLPRTIRELPPGDYGPLPGRRRAQLVPHICGIAACWPTNGPGNALLPVREPH